MKIVCAWCGREMGEKPLLEDRSVTHSICPECKEKHFDKKRKKKEVGEQLIKKPNAHRCFVAEQRMRSR